MGVAGVVDQAGVRLAGRDHRVGGIVVPGRRLYEALRDAIQHHVVPKTGDGFGKKVEVTAKVSKVSVMLRDIGG